MMRLTCKDICESTGGHVVGGDPGVMCHGLSIDTRKIERGQCFVAIKGAHFDGHDFLSDALASGAKVLVIRKGSPFPEGATVVEVGDTETALGDIASWWRRRFTIPCVAITGSNGKSTTKEMTAAIAGALGPVLNTEGNFNNLIGLPLTVFRLSDEHRVAILEMGMNAPGEIRRLTQVAVPTIGLITNVTAAHLEKLHTVEAVAKAKGELFETMNEDSIAIINGEDRRVHEISAARKGPKIVFGMQNDFDVRFLHMDMIDLESMKLKFFAMGREFDVMLPIPGSHNVMNALAAVSIGIALKIDPQEAANRLAAFEPMAMRMERVQLANGVRVVNDCYNANPESMKAAFRTVGAARRAGRFVAALGDMLELGVASMELHHQVGEAAAEMGVSRLYVMGDFAEAIASGARAGGLSSPEITVCADGVDELSRYLERDLRAGDVLLVKGSRGMRMERVVESLKNNIGMG